MKTSLAYAAAALVVAFGVAGAGESRAASCAAAGTAYAAYPGISCGSFAGRTQETGGNAADIIKAAANIGLTLTLADIIDKTDDGPVITQIAFREDASPNGEQGVITSTVPFTIRGLKGGNNPFNYAFYQFDSPVTVAAFNTFDAGLVNGGGNAPGLSFAVAAVPLPAAVWLFATAVAGLGLASRRRAAA